MDTILFGGTVVKAAARATVERADIGITAEVIVAVGNLECQPATERIDALGLVVTPGFIDAIY